MTIEDIQISIAATTKSLMYKEPFYGLFLLGMNKSITTRIKTAAVGRREFNPELMINPEFWSQQDEATRIGVLKHELLHIAFYHILQSDEYQADHFLHNLAADLEINQYIQKEHKGPTWEGMEIQDYPEFKFPVKAGTKEYFRILSEVNKKRDRPDPRLDPLGNLKSNIENPNDGSSPEKSKIWNTYDGMARGEIECTHEQWKEFTDGLDEASRKLLEKQIQFKLKETTENCRNRGHVPSELEALINALFEIEPPVVNWKEYLRRFAGSSDKIYTKKTRRKLNKRFIDYPGLKIKTKKHILIGMDTSGSVSDEDLMEFFSEIYHVWKTGVKVSIAECDAAISQIYEYKGETPTSVKGRGGTDFQPVVDYYNENYKKYNTMIYLTDGHCTAPDPGPRTTCLWVICSDGTDATKFPGITVKIQK